MANLETTTSPFSASGTGARIIVAAAFSSNTNLKPVHELADPNFTDCCNLWVQNNEDTRQTVHVIVAATSNSGSHADDADITVVCPPFGSVQVLSGHRILTTGADFQIAAWNETGGDVAITGWFDRIDQTPIPLP